MKYLRLREVARAGLAVGLLAGTAACEFDNNPYGPAYRNLHPTIVGVYRPVEHLGLRNSQVPNNIRPAPPGSDIRLVFGSAMTLSGRVFLPSSGPEGSTVDVRFYGMWEYDRVSRRITLNIDPSPANPAIEAVFQITILDNWVRLEGATEIAGLLLSFDLGKSLLEPESPSTGGPGFGNRVPVRRG
ncbi:hypothetical protein [Candidatus Palauibacter sp.]|uniref:hypothetical protein n=1 Tax=Candidatus Palauibacter sp. TaxID=3101350 RepID=UPI003B01CC74